MTAEQSSISAIFSEELNELETLATIHILEFLREIIPSSEIFYKHGYGSDTVEDAHDAGVDEVKKGNTLFMIDDDPDIVHWIAFNKKYIPIFKSLESHLPYGMFLQDFSVADLTWEGE